MRFQPFVMFLYNFDSAKVKQNLIFHSWQRALTPLILLRHPNIATTTPIQNCPIPHSSFCLASLAECVISPHVMCYFA